MWNEHLKLFSVEFMFKELEKHKLEILEKSGLSSPEFEVVVSLLSSRIEFIPFSDFKELVSLAEKISPDKNDAEYFALALKLGCGIWSNDKLLKHQEKVKVYSTAELLAIIKQD